MNSPRRPASRFSTSRAAPAASSSASNKESTNPQADVLVTLPPFIMKAAADGLLQPYTPAGADQIDAAQKDKGGLYVALVQQLP